jgi:hypothetical protein
MLSSLVLLQSLQQTRQHHVQELFPVFTTSQGSRPQGQEKCREEENSPPKHDIKLIGRCGLEVGPVSFQDVSLYECRFLGPGRLKRRVDEPISCVDYRLRDLPRDETSEQDAGTPKSGTRTRHGTKGGGDQHQEPNRRPHRRTEPF